MEEVDRAAYLAALSPGTEIDHRGTPFASELLCRLLNALRDATTGLPHIGDARFDEASFTGDARFEGALFTGFARFDEASFTDDAQFDRTSFTGDAWFYGASFTGEAWFREASFADAAEFEEASFSSGARFFGASFTSYAWFRRASFSGGAGFFAASFSRDVGFEGSRFEKARRLGPLVCGGTVVLDGAVFEAPVTVNIAARQVSCARTRWSLTSTLTCATPRWT
ncbi:pentapeptide repeat-containing protein [Streptomyces sp. MBT60]|uniref:pentapeptide repeat-containing protein n=1 Tax=Streptomyces sp. MBT60 TaxID=2800409 RepID=UPI0027DD89C7|nr:pentapeptide repeat-containing protein [Streptomyces sp. MBT60]